MSKLYDGEVNINLGDSKTHGKETMVRIYTDLKPGMNVYSNKLGNVEEGLNKALALVKKSKGTKKQVYLDSYCFGSRP